MKINKKILSLILASAMITGQTTTMFAASKSEKTKKEIKAIQEEKATISKKAKEVDSLINTTTSKLDTTKKELEDTLASKIKNEKLLDETKKDLEESVSHLKDEMVTYYMESYSANDSVLEMVLKSESISDYIVTSTHLEKIVNKQDELVDEVEELLEKQNKIVTEIKENEKDLKALKSKLDKDITNLSIKKGEFEKDLKKLNSRQEELQDILVVQQEEEERIKREILAAQQKLEQERAEAAAKAKAEAEANKTQNQSSNTNTNQNSSSNQTNNSGQNVSSNSSTSSGFRVPLNSYRVTSKFGYRTHPVTGQWSLHGGIDLAAPTGTPTYSIQSGTVITSTYSSSYGNYIIVDHGNGMASLYAHLSERGVSVGTKVSKGQVIGKVGSTGRSTGPHLHFEIRKNGERVNPASYISF